MRRLIADRTPDQLKLKFALWTREVSELIEAVYGVRLTMRNTGKYLKRWVFTPQRPLKKAYEQSPEAVGKWLNEEYSKIAAKAQVEGAEIEWGDKTGLRSDDVRGRGYSPKGQTPVAHANARREKTQRDLDGDEQGPDALEGLLGCAERQGPDRLFGSAGAPSRAEDHFDLGQHACASLEAGEEVVGRAYEEDRDLLSA